MYHKNLDRYFKVFVGGTLAGAINGVTECVEGAQVVLKHDGRQIAATRSDPYGDFKFQGLEEDSGGYEIEIADERFASKTARFELGKSTYLGAISLDPR